MNTSAQTKRSLPVWSLALGLILLTWAYWAGFVQMAEYWERDPQYSHGYLVPLIALVLLWYRHAMLKMGPPKGHYLGWILLVVGTVACFALPSQIVQNWGFIAAGTAIIGAGWLLAPQQFESGRFQPTWWGLPLLLLGVGMHLVAGYYYITSFADLSLIPALAGLILLTVGWHGIRWAWPAVLFAGFMMPLPHTLEGLLREPLRSVGTRAGTYLMQTCSLPAFADGNRNEIIVGGMTHRIGVNEACSGLSMLIIFFALSTAVAVVMQRTIWERLLIVFSAFPIAIISNVLRITVTGIMLYSLEGRDVYLGFGNLVLIDMNGTEFAQSFFHDWAGWMMMPLALFILWLELLALKRIIVVEEETPLSMTISENQESSSTSDEEQKSKTRKNEIQQAATQEVKPSAAVRGTH